MQGDETAAKVWDLPTRIFHWAIVVAFLVSWRTAEAGNMEWHYFSGIVALGLILFRLLWGVIGGSTARFSQFLSSPSNVMRYLRGPSSTDRQAGHNPLGGYSVVAMLSLLSLQVGTGLFSVDIDGLESGPLSFLVSFEQGRAAAEIHEASFNALAVLIGLHVLAILYYRFRHGRRLTKPMIVGTDRQLPTGAAELKPVPFYRFVIAAVICVALAVWVDRGFFL
ncbi:MAG: cytochrome b/b6 domain-containing protein [Novosphingobium sp.]|nr:cytochrome b/b6 domain-containing protein [Novosphingobium sp.]